MAPGESGLASDTAKNASKEYTSWRRDLTASHALQAGCEEGESKVRTTLEFLKGVMSNGRLHGSVVGAASAAFGALGCQVGTPLAVGALEKNLYT